MNKVSIIIPVYNTEKYIRRCIDSVLNQKFDDVEIVIVNDGSTDGSASIVRQIMKENKTAKRIKYKEKENGGLSSARNCGLNLSSGEFVMFLDSDDCLIESAIENLVKYSDNYDVIVGNYRYFNDVKCEDVVYYGKKEIVTNGMQNSDFYEYFFGSRYGISACNKLFRRIFLDNSGVVFQKNDEIYAEDLLFNYKLFACNPRIYITDSVTYGYYSNVDSITHTFKDKLPERLANLIKDYHSYNKKDVRGVVYLIANSVNTIAAQGFVRRNIYASLLAFRQEIKGVWLGKKQLRDSLDDLSLIRKVDYFLDVNLLFSSVSLLSLYHWVKRSVVGVIRRGKFIQ